MSKCVRVVKQAMAIVVTIFSPYNASGINQASKNIRTWNITQKSNGKLYNSHCHSFVVWMRTSHDNKHSAYFRC